MEELTVTTTTKPKHSILNAVQNYGKSLFNYIRRSVNNNEEAEDILQDVWYQLSSIIDLDTIEHLSAWLYRVTKNRIIDKKRKNSTLSIEDFTFETDEGEIVLPEGLLIEDMNPETELDRILYRELIFKAISELPEKQRQVFIMNELEDRTLQEIADLTGENIKTIISRKRYAVKQLQKQLKNLYDDL